MTDYRIVARHVRYWRGLPHKWSTVYPLTGTVGSGALTAIAAIKTLEMGVCFAAAGATSDGGVYEIAMYDQASGGVPIAVASYFDPDVPASWVPYTSGGWASKVGSYMNPAEVALGVSWSAGLSSSGKPVRFRKWYHSVQDISQTPPQADVSSGNVTSLQAWIDAQIAVVGGLGVLLGRGSRLAATTCVVDSMYGNHQMPRGRRRAPTKVSSSVAGLPPGILIVPGSDGSLST